MLNKGITGGVKNCILFEFPYSRIVELTVFLLSRGDELFFC